MGSSKHMILSAPYLWLASHWSLFRTPENVVLMYFVLLSNSESWLGNTENMCKAF